MPPGEWLTRGTVWLALTLYVAGQCAAAGVRLRMARALNTGGCAAFLGHVSCAFHFHHHWSHALAYAETARQTATVFGWNWGGGLYFNYGFALVWIAQVVHSWLKPGQMRQRAGWASWTVRVFFLLMIVNGAVVFVHGPMRWFGAILCVLLAVSWFKADYSPPRRAGPESDPGPSPGSR